MKEITLLVCGGRDFESWATMSVDLYRIKNAGYVLDRIVHGGATGADTMAGEFARIFKIPCDVYEANWALYAGQAGRIRNVRMLREAQPDMVLAMPGRTGTAHMVRIARDSGVPVVKWVPGGQMVISRPQQVGWVDFDQWPMAA